MESTPLSGMRWIAAVAACGLTACVGAFPQAPAGLGDDAEVTADTGVLAGSTPLDSPRPDAPPPESPPPVTAAPTQAGEPCTPGLCRECGPDGSARAPLEDPDCPPLDCSELVNGRLETNGRQAICLLTTYVPGLDGRCEAVGRCAVPEINFQNCGRQPEFAAPSIQDTACARFVNCERGNAQITTYAEGTACVLDGVRGACDGRGACVAAPPPPPAPTEPPTAPPSEPEDSEGRDFNCGPVGAVGYDWGLSAAICDPLESEDGRASCRYRFDDNALLRDASCDYVCGAVGPWVNNTPFRCVAAWRVGGRDDCRTRAENAIPCNQNGADLLCDCRP